MKRVVALFVSIVLISQMFLMFAVSTGATGAVVKLSDVQEKYNLTFLCLAYDGDASGGIDAGDTYQCYKITPVKYAFFKSETMELVTDVNLIDRLVKVAMMNDTMYPPTWDSLSDSANKLSETVSAMNRSDWFEAASAVINKGMGSVLASTIMTGTVSPSIVVNALADATMEEVDEVFLTMNGITQRFQILIFIEAVKNFKTAVNNANSLYNDSIKKMTTLGAQEYYDNLIMQAKYSQYCRHLLDALPDVYETSFIKNLLKGINDVCEGFLGEFFSNLKSADTIEKLQKKSQDIAKLAKLATKLYNASDYMSALEETCNASSEFVGMMPLIDKAYEAGESNAEAYNQLYTEAFTYSSSIVSEFTTADTGTPSTPSTPSSYTVGNYKIIASYGLNLRTGAGTNYSIITSIPVNTILNITEVSGNWGKITYNGWTGWICLGENGDDYVSKTTESGSSSSPTDGNIKLTDANVDGYVGRKIVDVHNCNVTTRITKNGVTSIVTHNPYVYDSYCDGGSKQCVDYAWGRIQDKLKFRPNWASGHGKDIATNAPNNRIMLSAEDVEYTVKVYTNDSGANIKADSLVGFGAVNGNAYGHVIYVEHVKKEGGTTYVYYTHGGAEYYNTGVSGTLYKKTLSQLMSTWGAYQGTVAFVSENNTQTPIAVTSVSLNKTSATLEIDDTLTLAATVLPNNADNKAVTWSSSNPAVATVSNGVVTALSQGTANITVKTVDGSKSAVCTVTVNPPVAPPAATEATYTIGTVKGKAGATVKVNLGFNSDNPANSLGISGITYDENVLTFIGFEDTEAIEDLTVLPPTFDENLKAVIIPLKTATTSIDSICTLVFKINESAADGNYTISATSVTKNGSNIIPSEVKNGTVTVISHILGDIDGNESVDIDDAIALFRYSMFPELYPVAYIGNMDFDSNGSIDIDDAVAVFRYSMFPELYPLD